MNFIQAGNKMIKNKLKLGLFILSFVMVFGVVAQVNAQALTWTADQTVHFTDPDIDLTIVSGSAATSLVIGTGTLQLVVPASSTFTLTSANREITATGQTTATVTDSCVSGTMTLVITGGAGGETITITPEAAACGAGGGSSGGSGGGGSGSSSGDNDDEDTPPATAGDEGCAGGNAFNTMTGAACSSVVVGCGLGNAYSPVTGQSCAGVVLGTNVNTTIITTPGAAGNFGYAFGLLTVRRGTTGPACKAWQMFFNAHRNAGLVTDGICGPLSMAAAVAWQASVGLVADGLLGPMSRAKANIQAGMSTQGN